jgi:hypothetical protein
MNQARHRPEGIGSLRGHVAELAAAREAVRTVTPPATRSFAIEVVPDAAWPGMWRIKLPDGRLTDQK